ncbi:MAG: hypothetical protein J6S58_05760 [Lentisphaeria bacterium]|nr:hypothetical protein [Lentisphaeria bacterium]
MFQKTFGKSLLLPGLLLFSPGEIFSAETPLKGKEDFIQSGVHRITLSRWADLRIAPAGITLTPYMRTDKWRGFNSPGTRVRKNGEWKYTVEVPAAKNDTLFFETSLHGKEGASALQYSISWRLADPGNCRELFLYLELPYQSFRGRNMLINGRKVPIITHENKFAYYKQTAPLDLILYPGEKNKELRIRSKQPLRISCESHKKGNRVWIRIYTVNNDTRVDFEITSR